MSMRHEMLPPQTLEDISSDVEIPNHQLEAPNLPAQHLQMLIERLEPATSAPSESRTIKTCQLTTRAIKVQKLPRPHEEDPLPHPMSLMPALHCLFFSTPSSSTPANGGINPATHPPPTLSAKPPTIHPHKTPLDLPPSLPGLSSDAREKILSLEIMGVDSSRALALNPSLSAASPDSIHSVISFLLSKGIHHKDLARILGMCPRVLTSDVRSDLAPVFDFLARDLNIPEADFRRVVNKCPRLLVSGVRDQLRPALVYLQRLGFRDATALAYNDPVLLVSSVEGTLIPKLRHLKGLGFSREEVVEMVLRCPSLLTFSVENNFKPKFEYFEKEIRGGLEDLKGFPQYFAFSLEKRIKPRHEEMVAVGMSLPLSLMLKTTDREFEEMLAERGSRSSMR